MKKMSEIAKYEVGKTGYKIQKSLIIFLVSLKHLN